MAKQRVEGIAIYVPKYAVETHASVEVWVGFVGCGADCCELERGWRDDIGDLRIWDPVKAVELSVTCNS